MRRREPFFWVAAWAALTLANAVAMGYAGMPDVCFAWAGGQLLGFVLGIAMACVYGRAWR